MSAEKRAAEPKKRRGINSVASQEAQELSAFLGHFFDRYMTDGTPIPSEIHPLNVMREMAERSPKRALLGLKMAIGDCLEMARGWPPEQVQEADDALRSEGIVTLSELRIRYYRQCVN